MYTLKNVEAGAKLINKEEPKMVVKFIDDITKDPTKKRQGKTPMIRIQVFSWLVESGLLENGFVRNYEVIEIAKSLKMKLTGSNDEETKKARDLACRNIRREITVLEKLGLVKTFKNKYTVYKLDRLPDENDKEYKRRCKNTEYGVTTKVKWMVVLQDKFYSECDRIGCKYTDRISAEKVNELNNNGIEFSKLSKSTWSSYSYNYTERTTMTCTGTVKVTSNATEIKNIIEERKEQEEVQAIEEPMQEQEEAAIIEEVKEEKVIPEVNIEEPTKEEAVINTIEEDLPDSIEKLDYEIANFRTAIKRGKHGRLGSPERKKACDRLKALEDKKEELKKNVKKEENVTKVNNKRQIWEKEFKESDYILVSEMMGINNWLKNKYERYSIENDLRLRSYNSAKDFVITEEGETFLGVFKGLLITNKVLNYNTVKTLLDTTLSYFIEEMIIIEEIEEEQ